jgi:predicted transcriptional regulator of viral defense system
MKKILYLILKKDMIKKLSKNHGTQFVDDVMETFGIATNTTNEYLNSLKKEEKCEFIN